MKRIKKGLMEHQGFTIQYNAEWKSWVVFNQNGKQVGLRTFKSGVPQEIFTVDFIKAKDAQKAIDDYLQHNTPTAK